MSDLKVYENIQVSGVQYDFSRHPHESIPHRLFADWTALTRKIANAVNPTFNIPAFPEFFKFTTVMIHSDEPYPSDENYYTLDFVYFELTGDKDYGIRISFENGRWSGDNSVVIETTEYVTYATSFQPNFIVSSHIPKAATSPLARFHIWHEAEKTPEIEGIFARHLEYCLSHATT